MIFWTWWRHQLETFSALLAICAGNSQVTGEFPPQRPVTRSFDVLFDLPLNKRLSKQSWGWRFEMPSRPLWRQRNGHKRKQSDVDAGTPLYRQRHWSNKTNIKKVKPELKRGCSLELVSHCQPPQSRLRMRKNTTGLPLCPIQIGSPILGTLTLCSNLSLPDSEEILKAHC